jgi:GNAT superfamily N-acetyltransferase
MLRIEKVDFQSKAQVDKFVMFHYKLYKSCPQWVPPFINDIRLMLNPEKHPYYEHSDAEFYVAMQDGEVVGRIGAMENKPFNKYHDSAKAQFYLFDSIDDQDVANALFARAEEWAHQRKLTEVVGPKGFGPLDGYGIQVEGFEYRQMMNMMNYNYPYYIPLLEKAGYSEANVFVSCHLRSDTFQLPEKAREIARRVIERGTISVKRFKNKKELVSWGWKIGQAYNKSFVNNWEYYPLSEREVSFVIDNIMLIADPQLMKILLHKDDVIGFLFTFPDVSAAMQRGKGYVTPWSIADLLLETKRTKWLSLNGVGVLPEFQGRGGNALMYYEIEKTVRDSRFVDAEETQMADTAVQVRKDMENLGAKIYKRHRVYKKSI